MTWGSNATFMPVPCRFCGTQCCDDEASGLNSHEMACPRRSVLRVVWLWLKGEL
jgi:hypothetical protein